jgi:hypothetical protein
MKSVLVATILLIVGVLAVFAGVPQTINYQGYLKDSAGVPVSSETRLTFSLYSTTSGAGSVWNSTAPGDIRVSVTPANGIYSVELGATPLPPLPTQPLPQPSWTRPMSSLPGTP